MKDEGMAEEYARKTLSKDCCDLKLEVYKRTIKAFLAGLKAGRPQWHDLRENPNDLPKGGMYLTLRLNDENTCYKYCVAFLDKDEKVFNTIFCGKVNSEDIIAWCEIPTFDKE